MNKFSKSVMVVSALLMSSAIWAQQSTNDAGLPILEPGQPPAGTQPVACDLISSFSGNQSQLGRVFRDNVPSTCPGKAFPGTIDDATPFYYETFDFYNPNNANTCVTINFDPDAGAAPCGTNAHASAYNGSYDPLDKAANFLGDVGASVSQPFSMEVPAFGNLVVVVNNNFSEEICDFDLQSVEIPCGEPPQQATFEVNKVFTDSNPAEVEVTLNCFTGLPITQSQTISESQNVKFIVESFADGELDCDVTEADVTGYSASYFNGFVDSSDGCAYEDVSFGNGNVCTITNSPDPVEVSVFKDWIIEGEGGDSIDAYYRLTLACFGEIEGGFTHGPSGIWRKSLYDGSYLGTSDAEFTAEVVPDWDGGTDCWVLETVYDSAVEVTNGCGSNGNPGIVVELAGGGSCTVTNTVFFEGIPTLSQYGMAILALLMLGVGFVGFRRFV